MGEVKHKHSAFPGAGAGWRSQVEETRTLNQKEHVLKGDRILFSNKDTPYASWQEELAYRKDLGVPKLC